MTTKVPPTMLEGVTIDNFPGMGTAAQHNVGGGPTDISTNSSMGLSFRNVIVNGRCALWQRNTTQSTVGYGSVDRFFIDFTGGTMFLNQSADTPTNEGANYAMQEVTTSAGGTPSTRQRIEGNSTHSLCGRKVTVSVFAKQTVGTSKLVFELRYANTPNDFSNTTLIETSTAQTLTSGWVRYTWTTTGIMPTGVINGLEVILTHDATTTTTTRYYTLVQVEAGEAATPFEYLPDGLEYMLCSRYYQQFTQFHGHLWITYTPNGDTRGRANFPVPMRTTPTVTFSTSTWQMIGASASAEPVNINMTGVVPFDVSKEGYGLATNAIGGYGTNLVWGPNTTVTVYASAEL